MKKMTLIAALLSGVFVSGCQESTSTEPAPTISDVSATADENRLRAHLRFLSDDLLEGRDTGTDGHEVASLYIATELEKYGLIPAGDNESYMQRVTFRQAYLDQTSPKMTITGGNEEIQLDYPADYLAGVNMTSEAYEVSAPLVFAGYGIVAPEMSHDDYASLDVNGKIVVVLSGKPKRFPSEEGAHWGSSSQKKQHAADKGAVGFITISTPTAEKVRPYQNLLNYLHTPTVRWLDAEGLPANDFPALKGSAYLSQRAAQHLFKDAQASLDMIYEQLERDESPAGFDLPYSMAMSASAEFKEVTSPNVVAVLPGSDPILKDQYVVYSAHSDHIGFAKTVKKDNINNGAMDNASGTSVLLETARLFSEAAERPKRSLLFVAVTGEEKGLLGSDYYARNPTVPEGAMVANVNLDMPILTYEFADVIAFGANHSDLQASVSKAAEDVGISLSPDPWPEQALFTRSDHYSFVKQGIPSVFLVPGLQSADPDVDAAKVFGQFLGTHYHKPSDDFNQPFNWKAATKFTEVNYQIGNTLANQEQTPRWNDGDFFGDTFASN